MIVQCHPQIKILHANRVRTKGPQSARRRATAADKPSGLSGPSSAADAVENGFRGEPAGVDTLVVDALVVDALDRRWCTSSRRRTIESLAAAARCLAFAARCRTSCACVCAAVRTVSARLATASDALRARTRASAASCAAIVTKA